MALKELMARPFYAELKEGKHAVTLISWKYMPQPDSKNDYIAMTFQVDDQPYKRNMFERDISIMISHVRRQLDLQNTTIPDIGGFLDKLVADKTELNMWVTYPVVPTKSGLQRRQNIYFIEPSSDSIPASVGEDTDEVPPTMS